MKKDPQDICPACDAEDNNCKICDTQIAKHFNSGDDGICPGCNFEYEDCRCDEGE